MAETTQVLGQVPVNRGTYNADAQYYKDNIVQFENGSYYCKATGPVQGINPDNDEVWGLWSGFPLSTEYQDNEEFIRVILDNDGKVLAGIRKDGSVTWSKGVPAPIAKYIRVIETTLKNNIQSTSTEVRTSINELTQKIVDTGSAHKDIVETFKYIEDNSEYISVITDSNGVIIFGIKTDGTVYIPKGVPEELKEIHQTFSFTENGEFAVAIVTQDNYLLFGIRHDGSTYTAKDKIPELQQAIKEIKNRLDSVESIYADKDNEEFVYVIKDAYSKVLLGIRIDGSIYIPKGSSEDTKKAFELLNEVSKELYSDVEDRLELLLDSEGKILSYRKKDGTLVEKRLEVDTVEVNTLNINGSLGLSPSVANQLYDDLKKEGFGSVKTDWSDSSSLYIDTPRRAIVNITNIAAMPTTKTTDAKAWLEFWDMNGNYFKKRVILNAQGNSSMGFIKKNFAIDICNDEWDGDDTFELKIGDWPAFDSFHCKAYYTEFLRGAGIIAYQIADQIEKLRGPLKDRAWKRAKIDADNLTGVATYNKQQSGISLAMDNGARCMPDGFPIWVYLNGEFYGIFSWQIKKHRDNYHMNKKTYTEIHLDGTITAATLFNANGDSSKVDWTAFEVRNPKSLYTMDGAKYDGDDNCNELIDESSNSYVAKTHKNTVTTKNAILLLSTYVTELTTLQKSGATNDKMRAKFAEFFDVESFIDYAVTQGVTRDADGFGKNWQWVTYNGIKWAVLEYDKDMSFGNHFTGKYTTLPPTSGYWLGNTTSTPMGWALKYFMPEIKAKWLEAVSAGILTFENITSKIKTWMDRVSPAGYEAEYKKWNEAPAFRDNGVGEGWVIYPAYPDTTWVDGTSYSNGAFVTFNNRFYKSLKSSNKNALTDTTAWEDITYNAEKQYKEGNIIGYYKGGRLLLKAITDIRGIEPFTKSYSNNPSVGGYYDSYWRFAKYVEQTLDVMNKYVNSL